MASLTGGSPAGQDFAKFEGLELARQAQIVEGPIPGWKAVRVSVRHGDVDKRYSDQRALFTANPSVRMDEGGECWQRYLQMYPEDWIGSFPKWDQLDSWPGVIHSGGSSNEWHHAPLNEDWSNFGGSAPIYFRADDKNFNLILVDRKTSDVRKGIVLGPLDRGKWHEFIVHTKWSTDPGRGLIEVWMDGKQVCSEKTYTLYQGCYNYFIVGLYRNIHIGDPALKWPKTGKPVYPKGDGAPQSTYLAGFVIGDTRKDVVDAYPPLGTTRAGASEKSAERAPASHTNPSGNATPRPARNADATATNRPATGRPAIKSATNGPANSRPATSRPATTTPATTRPGTNRPGANNAHNGQGRAADSEPLAPVTDWMVAPKIGSAYWGHLTCAPGQKAYACATLHHDEGFPVEFTIRGGGHEVTVIAAVHDQVAMAEWTVPELPPGTRLSFVARAGSTTAGAPPCVVVKRPERMRIAPVGVAPAGGRGDGGAGDRSSRR